MFNPNWGRLALYIGSVTLIYAMSAQIEWLRALVTPALVLAASMFAADILEYSGRKVESPLMRIAGAAAALTVLPAEIFPWKTQMAMVVIGTGTALVGPSLKRNSRLVRGTGIFILFYGLSEINALQPVRSVFLCAGAFLFVGYAVAEFGHRGHLWAEMVERNLIGIGILGGILGLYTSVRGELSTSYPGLVFYGEWIALVLGVVVAGSMVYSVVSKSDPEKYLISQWRRHEAKTVERFGPEMAKARKAVEDFVVRGKKGPLVTFIAYYGAQLFGDRGKVEELVSRIADYEEKKTSPLTPLWIRKAYERRELENRLKIVEEVFDELKRMMG